MVEGIVALVREPSTESGGESRVERLSLLESLFFSSATLPELFGHRHYCMSFSHDDSRNCLELEILDLMQQSRETIVWTDWNTTRPEIDGDLRRFESSFELIRAQKIVTHLH